MKNQWVVRRKRKKYSGFIFTKLCINNATVNHVQFSSLSLMFKEMIFQIVTCVNHFDYKFPELSPDDSSSENNMYIIIYTITKSMRVL